VEEAEGNNAVAAEIYPRLITTDDRSATPYFRLAVLSFREGDFQRSADLLDAAVRIDPTHADAYFLLGESYEKLGMLKDAATAYGESVRLDPKSLRGIDAQRRIREIMKDYKP
jgi:tetratricopeptide (TPR) repeat protein